MEAVLEAEFRDELADI